jgi:hypothetical protein
LALGIAIVFGEADPPLQMRELEGFVSTRRKYDFGSAA